MYIYIYTYIYIYSADRPGTPSGTTTQTAASGATRPNTTPGGPAVRRVRTHAVSILRYM